jgi:hypothetical protein
MKWICVALCALALTACGGSYDYEQMRAYVDQCIIETGPQTERNNVTDYCQAKWRQSQRDKAVEK